MRNSPERSLEVPRYRIYRPLDTPERPCRTSLTAAERNLITEIRTRALALKRQGMSAEDAGKQVGADLKTQHPDWPNTNAAGFVRSVYAEP